LSDGLIQAVENLRQMPAGNRHLVIISDGLDEAFKPDEVIKYTTASGVTVHFISYTSLTDKVPTAPVSRPREKSAMPQDLILAMPHTHEMRRSTT
jgi:hypothetical protein